MDETAERSDSYTQRHKPRQHTPRIVSVLSLFLIVNLAMSLYYLPLNRLIERRICADHYRSIDPTKVQPDGSVDEKLCKIREIEKGLGRIQGAMETLWVAGGKSIHSPNRDSPFRD